MISTESLSKSYRGTKVVDDVSFTCEPGTITGFLGPNGAGKSTTLRMITGLTRPDRGRATVDGVAFTDLPNPSRVIGTLLDPTAMHPGRSGRSTLGIAARTAGVPSRGVDELLDLVGLAGPAAGRRVGNYSLGMRQRLGIALALIGQPRALVLDEPANGLDPEGIAWMRHLLRGFADRGGTVLLSSHLLTEVQATVDRLVVISRGSVVASGALADLLAAAGLVVRSTEPDALARLLGEHGASFTATDDGALLVDSSVAGMTAERIARLALDARVLVTELRASDANGLEALFFSLTAEGPTAAEAAA